MKFTSSLLLIIFHLTAFCQTDTTWKIKPELNLQTFVDVYYGYDFNRPTTEQRQSFLFNHNRHNGLNLNLGFVKLNVIHQKYRANLGLQIGTYPNDNYAAEPSFWKYVSDANVGISINKKGNAWLDAGIFSSHIGFESAISTDNLTLTRSLLAENSPYYLAGIKYSYEPSKKWLFSGLLLNGWQRIRVVKGNSLPSFGTQLTYKSSKNVVFNWSTFIGTDDPDSLRRMRYFSNLYVQLQPLKQVKLIIGYDMGIQQADKKSTNYNYWYSPVIIAQLKLSDKWHIAGRFEYYSDQNNVIISTIYKQAFQTFGYSFNVDYSPNEYTKIRIEARNLSSRNTIFTFPNGLTNQSFFICSSLAFAINQPLKRVKK